MTVRTVVWNCLGGLWCGIVWEDGRTVVRNCLGGREDGGEELFGRTVVWNCLRRTVV